MSHFSFAVTFVAIMASIGLLTLFGHMAAALFEDWRIARIARLKNAREASLVLELTNWRDRALQAESKLREVFRLLPPP
jgi:hypothetical protein